MNIVLAAIIAVVSLSEATDGQVVGRTFRSAGSAGPDHLRQGYGGPPKLHAEAEGPAYNQQQVPAQQPNLIGRVLHADLAVPGATVTATRAQRTITTTSDENGVFRFAGLDPGGWTITIEMRGFAKVTQEITIPFDQPELAVTLTMRKYEEIVGPAAVPITWASVASDAVGAAGLAIAADATAAADEPPSILTGSMVNGAASRFAQARAIGNNRPRPAGLYSGGFSATLGNSAWNARPYSFTGTAATTPSYADAQLAVNLSGPFRIPFLLKYGPMTQVSYSHGVQHNASSQSALVPTLAERGGDLSSRPNVIRDPLTGQPFTGNVIPADRIVPQAAALLPFYPLPETTASGANLQRSLVGQSISDSVQVSTNKSLNQRTSLGGTFSYQRSRGNSVNLFDFTDRNRQSSFNAGLTLNHQISRRMTLRVNYQFTSSSSVATPFFSQRINVSGDAGIAGNAQDPANWGPPAIAFPDFADLRDGTYQSSSRASHVVGGQAMLRRGSHNITFGADARFNSLDLLTQTDPRGTLSFTGAATGDAFADFLLGLPTTSAIAFGNSSARIHGGLFDVYISDDFRFRPGVTFELGVRWEYETPYSERNGRLANLDVASGFSAVMPVLGSDPVGGLTGSMYRSSLVQRDRLGIQPRLGVSWRPMLASSLVIKGGYGLYRNLGVYQSIGTLLAQQPPFSSTFNVQSTPTTPLSLANPFPAAASSATTTFAVDPEFSTALLHSWQVTVQQDLPASLTVLGAYFGDHGAHLAQAFLPNTYPAGAVNPCGSCPSGFVYLTSGGTSTRQAAQLVVRRRLYAGFTSSLTYTLAKATDNASTFSATSVSPGSLSLAQNWLDLAAERGPSSFDQRHLVSVEMQYTTGMGLTGGTLVDGFWGGLFKDWTMTARFNAGSGLPLTPVFFAAVPGTGVVGVRPSLTGEPIAPAVKGTYANAAAFTTPAPGTWGNAGRNSIRGPGTSSFDLTLARAFRLPKRKTIEWRLAATNVLNRVTFSTIDRIVTSPQFGRPTAANQMRRIQTFLSFKF